MSERVCIVCRVRGDAAHDLDAHEANAARLDEIIVEAGITQPEGPTLWSQVAKPSGVRAYLEGREDDGAS